MGYLKNITEAIDYQSIVNAIKNRDLFTIGRKPTFAI